MDNNNLRNNGRWMIYGAYGYTGRLIAAEAHRRGLEPVLAGRDQEKLRPVARELGLERRAFPLDHARGVKQHLGDVSLVLNCAGPFSATADPLLKACLARNVHYLDITGEVDVLELAHGYHRLARQAGVVLCPGVGFDVVPTDCLALHLHRALPDADHLALGFDSASTVSVGSAKTTLEALAQGGRVRRDGQLERVPLAHHRRMIDFGDGPKAAVTIPWGDVATAYYTTGIPNVEVYAPLPRSAIRRIRLLNTLRPLLGLQPLQRTLKRMIEHRVQGPDAPARRRTPTYIWGEAGNAAGQQVCGRISTANVYDLTVHAALGIVERLRTGEAEAGFTTPARLMGADYITTLPGSGPLELE